MMPNKSTRKKKGGRESAVIYCRQSWEKEESISLEEQERVCREYCESQGYEVIDVIPEQKTARVWSKRKGVVRAMSLIESGAANVLVLRRWNRLSRKRVHWALAEMQFERAGGRIESVLEQVDAATAAGRLQRGMLIELSQYQSDLIGEEWKATHAWRRRQGLPSAGGDRYGYTWHRRTKADAERYEIDETIAPDVRWMYDTYTNGRSTQWIARDLNRRGVASPGGGTWNASTVRYLLDSGFCAGLLPVSRRDPETGASIHIPWPDRTWDAGAHEAIIGEQAWAAYQDARTRRLGDPPRTVTPSHPLSGLARCGADGCNAAMIRRGQQLICGAAVSGNGAWTSIFEPRAHRLILAWLAQFADEIEATADSADATIPRPSRRSSARLQDRLESVAAELKALARNLGRDLVDEETHAELTKDLLAERNALREALAEPEPEEEPLPSPALIRDLVAEWETLPVLDRRELLRTLTSRIVVHPPARKYGRARLEITPRWRSAGEALRSVDTV